MKLFLFARTRNVCSVVMWWCDLAVPVLVSGTLEESQGCDWSDRKLLHNCLLVPPGQWLAVVGGNIISYQMGLLLRDQTSQTWSAAQNSDITQDPRIDLCKCQSISDMTTWRSSVLKKTGTFQQGYMSLRCEFPDNYVAGWGGVCG